MALGAEPQDVLRLVLGGELTSKQIWSEVRLGVADHTVGKSFRAALVLAKCPCRVDTQDSRAGNSTGDSRDCKQEDTGTCEGHLINRRNAEQQAAYQFLRGPGATESYGRTKRGHFQALLQHEPKNSQAAGSQRN